MVDFDWKFYKRRNLDDQERNHQIEMIKEGICPKNLTFPKAERDQQCPFLVVAVFCLFIQI